VGELQSALDALAAEDLHALVAPQLLDQTADLVRVRNRLDAEIARRVRVAELTQAPEHDGLKSMASWLRGHPRLSPAAASQLVRNGRALEKLPAVAAGCSEGVITAEQVAVVAAVVQPDNVAKAAHQGVDLAEVDVVLAETAATRQHAQLGRVVAHYLARLDPDGSEPDPTEGRSLTLARHGDGSVTGRFELDPVGGEKLQAALESMVQAARPKGDLRTRAQRLGDGLVQLADLLDPSTGPAAASTGFGAILSAARTRWAACAGSSSSATGTACSPAAKPRPTGATSTICSSGCSTRARRRWTTRRPMAHLPPDGTQILIAPPLLADGATAGICARI
jgi:hypothetical protein